MSNLKCPACKSKHVIPIVYGMPTVEAHRQVEQGKIKLGGCVLSADNPNYYCRNCHHEWMETSFLNGFSD